MNGKIAKVIRFATIPPIMAAVLLFILALAGTDDVSAQNLCFHFVFLTVLPISSYPVARLIPILKNRGRPFERKLAIIFCLLGYVGSVSTAIFVHGVTVEKIMSLTYLLSGAITALLSACNFRSSGHACGFSGPIFLLSYAVSPWFTAGFALLAPIFWASLTLKRHTFSELVCGTLVPLVSLLASIFVFVGF